MVYSVLKQRMNQNNSLYLFAFLFILFLSNQLLADTHTWDGGGADNNMSTAANWVGDVPPAFGDALVFEGSTRTTPVNDFYDGISFASITFSAGSSDFTVSGNRINLTGGASAIQGNHTSGTMTLSLDVDYTTSAPTITQASGGNLTMSGNGQKNGWLLTFNSAGTITFSGILSGSGGVTKNGSGSLYLTGTNTYTGGTTLNAGVLGTSNSAGFGNISGSITIAGGTLRNSSASGLTLNNYPFIIQSSFSLTSAGGNFNLGSGAVTLQTSPTITTSASGGSYFNFLGIISGAYNIIHAGSGYLSFSGTSSTFTGTYTENSSWGTYVSSLTNLSSNSSLGAPSTVENGTIDFNGGTSSVQLVLVGSSSFSTNRVINLGGTTGGIIVYNLMSNSYSATFTSDLTATGNGNKTLVLTGGNTADNLFSGIIPDPSTGAISVTVNEGSKYILSGTNTYTGTTTISSGTLQIGNGSTTGIISNSSNVANSDELIVNRSNDWTYSGVISGTGTLEKTGAGAYTLTGTNTYTGETTITNGNLQIGDNGTTGIIASSSIVNNSELTFSRSDDITYSGVISGTGTLEKLSAGTLTLSGANTFTGDILFPSQAVTDGGTILVTHANGLGVGPKTVSMLGHNNVNNTIELSGGITITDIDIETAGRTDPGYEVFLKNVSGDNIWNGDVSIVAAGGGYHIDSDAGTLTINGTFSNSYSSERYIYLEGASNGVYNGVIQDGTSMLHFRKGGTGTWIISADNTYTGTTGINAGTLQIGNGGTTGSVTSSTIANASELIVNRSDAWNYSGVISGVGNLTKQGAGTLTLSGANTYTGTTTIEAGKIEFGIADALASTDVILNSANLSTGATIGYSADLGTLDIIDSNTISLGTGNHTLTFTNSSAVTWSSFVTIEGWSDVSKYNGTAAGASHPKIFVGSDATGLTAGQLAKIAFLHPSNGDLYESTILSTGEVVPTASPLPVELISYKARFIYDQTVKIDWETASEINSESFKLYHSTDGNNFSLIHSVQAAGNSNYNNNYLFQHTTAAPINFYKLIQIDLDGTVHHKGVKVVRQEVKEELIKIHPNPSSSVFKIVTNNEPVNLKLYNNKGQLIKQWNLAPNNHIIFGQNLAPGNYYVETFSGGNSNSFKITKI